MNEDNKWLEGLMVGDKVFLCDRFEEYLGYGNIVKVGKLKSKCVKVTSKGCKNGRWFNVDGIHSYYYDAGCEDEIHLRPYNEWYRNMYDKQLMYRYICVCVRQINEDKISKDKFKELCLHFKEVFNVEMDEELKKILDGII